jgi:hypothetical protein
MSMADGLATATEFAKASKDFYLPRASNRGLFDTLQQIPAAHVLSSHLPESYGFRSWAQAPYPPALTTEFSVAGLHQTRRDLLIEGRCMMRRNRRVQTTIPMKNMHEPKPPIAPATVETRAASRHQMRLLAR